MASTPKPPNKALEVTSSQAFDTWLERKLHEMFDSVTAEPLPKELSSLLEQLGKVDEKVGNKD